MPDAIVGSAPVAFILNNTTILEQNRWFKRIICVQKQIHVYSC